MNVMSNASVSSSETASIVFALLMISLACAPPPDQGPCFGRIQMWYYDHRTRSCAPFEYSGCRGNENKFVREEQCLDTCVNRVLLSHWSRSKRLFCTADMSLPFLLMCWTWSAFLLLINMYTRREERSFRWKIIGLLFWYLLETKVMKMKKELNRLITEFSLVWVISSCVPGAYPCPSRCQRTPREYSWCIGVAWRVHWSRVCPVGPVELSTGTTEWIELPRMVDIPLGLAFCR